MIDTASCIATHTSCIYAPNLFKYANAFRKQNIFLLFKFSTIAHTKDEGKKQHSVRVIVITNSKTFNKIKKKSFF